jgi:hypothetical protein
MWIFGGEMKFSNYIKESHMDDFGDTLVPVGEGLFRYSNGENVNLVSAAGLSRLLQYYENGAFAIIAAYRDGWSKEEKIEKNRELRAVFNGLKMGVYQLVEHWRKCRLKGLEYEGCPKDKFVDVVERSYFVTESKDMSDEGFEKTIYELVQKFDQDAAVLWVDKTAYALSRLGKKDKIATQLTLNTIALGYSQFIRKMEMLLTFIGVEQPASISAMMIMKACGIKWVAG